VFPGPNFLLVCHGLYAAYVTCPSNSPRSDHRNFVWWRVAYTSWSSTLCNVLHLPITSLCALFCSAPLSPYSSLIVTTDQVLHPEEATNKIIRFQVFVAVKATYVFSKVWHRIVRWMLIIFQRTILSPVEGTRDWMHMLACSRSEYEHTTQGGAKVTWHRCLMLLQLSSNFRATLYFYLHSRLEVYCSLIHADSCLPGLLKLFPVRQTHWFCI
jgi:hypothetical protein